MIEHYYFEDFGVIFRNDEINNFLCLILNLKDLDENYDLWNSRSSPPEVFLGKGVLKICNRFTGEHPWRSAISIKLKSNFIEIALRHGCCSVNLLHIFRTPFPKNTSGGLFLEFQEYYSGYNVHLYSYFSVVATLEMLKLHETLLKYSSCYHSCLL